MARDELSGPSHPEASLTLSLPSPLGLESGVVRLAAYDPRWPDLFRAEAERIHSGIAPLSLTLEHIGSTSVPDLIAKPVLDILAGYEDTALLPEYIRRVSDTGYLHRGERGIPGREFFRRGDPRSYHLHLVLLGGTFWREHLAFRNALRSDAHLRNAYANLKTRLAESFPRDRESYIEGKTEFVLRALGR